MTDNKAVAVTAGNREKIVFLHFLIRTLWKYCSDGKDREEHRQFPCLQEAGKRNSDRKTHPQSYRPFGAYSENRGVETPINNRCPDLKDGAVLNPDQVLFHGYRREYGSLDEIVPVIFGKNEVQLRVAWQSPF